MEDHSGKLDVSHALKWGVIRGLVVVLISIVLFVIDTSLVQNGIVTFLLWCIGTGILIYAGINHRNEIGGGFMSYGTAFKHAFLLLVVAGLINTIYSMILLNVIAPEYRDMLTEMQMEGMMNSGADSGMLDTFNSLFTNLFTPIGLIITYFVGLIGSAIWAAIIALITKKKNLQADF